LGFTCFLPPSIRLKRLPLRLSDCPEGNGAFGLIIGYVRQKIHAKDIDFHFVLGMELASAETLCLADHVISQHQVHILMCAFILVFRFKCP
jgi:hypothetical protein